MPNFVVLPKGLAFNGLRLVRSRRGLIVALAHVRPGPTKKSSALNLEGDFNGLVPARNPKAPVVAQRFGARVPARIFNRTGVADHQLRARDNEALLENRGPQRGEEHEDQDPSVWGIDQGPSRSAGGIERMGATSPGSRHGVVHRSA
uniref:Uncharacterized protein n=1 Tax=Nitrospira defluvii TaxID=330214 RepID=B3U4L3_9BACT|nr:protein of unknown function [Nitrospira defluvii]